MYRTFKRTAGGVIAVWKAYVNGLPRANRKHIASRGDGEPSVIKGNRMTVR